jgi:hypothetical protein
MYDPTSTDEQLNTLIEFRQAVYDRAFRKRRDALFELLDALLVVGPTVSFPHLSLALTCQRKWPSLYQAIEEGTLDRHWLSTYLAQQVPEEGICYWSLDCSPWERVHANKSPGRVYVYKPTPLANRNTVSIGYIYSLLDWAPRYDQSWTLSVDVQRVASTQKEWEAGIEQIRQLNKAREHYNQVLDIVVADAKYGNHKFLRPLHGQRCGIVVAMRCDRILYRAPRPEEQKRFGPKRKHGRRFAFKEPETWEQADELLTFTNERWGQVELRRWKGLHERAAADVPLDVVQARIHLERAKPPKPLWLAWEAPPNLSTQLQVTVWTIWQAYLHRWPVEPSIRFRKQDLLWTTPQFHTPERGDLWSTLVSLALWMLYLARPVVEDRPMAWQKKQQELTPARVQRGWAEIFCTIGTPVRPPKTRGKSPGWPTGKPRQRRERQQVVRKTPKKTKRKAKAA